MFLNMAYKCCQDLLKKHKRQIMGNLRPVNKSLTNLAKRKF